jgi:hypothetical protein
MSKYAVKTTVPVEKSRLEFETLMRRYHATGFRRGWTENREVLEFSMNNRIFRFDIPVPTKTDVNLDKRKYRMDYDKWLAREIEQIHRQRWRRLLLYVKAALEMADEGLWSLESMFLAKLVLPDDTTVESFLVPQIEESYSTQKMPPLLGIGTSEDKP